MRGRTAVILLLGIAVIIPATGMNTYYLSLMVHSLIICLLTLSWDLLGGVAGQISLGQALFFGTGSYCFAYVAAKAGAPAAFIASLSASVAIGLVTGVFAARLMGMFRVTS